jgi:transposase
MTQVTVLTGRDRRRKWDLDDRHRILTMAFAPGAVIADIARQFDIASSMIYKWRRQALATQKVSGFAPAIITADSETLPSVPSVPSPLAPQSATAMPVAITVEFPSGVRLKIEASASSALVTAALRALQ